MQPVARFTPCHRGAAYDFEAVVLMSANLDAARSGDQLKALEQLRDTLAEKLDDADANIVAQISGQYRQVLADIAAVAPKVAKPKADELRERREKRRAG